MFRRRAALIFLFLVKRFRCKINTQWIFERPYLNHINNRVFVCLDLENVYIPVKLIYIGDRLEMNVNRLNRATRQHPKKKSVTISLAIEIS